MQTADQHRPRYAVKVPESIQTPDVLENSSLGRLEFFDGIPSDETVRKAYDRHALQDSPDVPQSRHYWQEITR